MPGGNVGPGVVVDLTRWRAFEAPEGDEGILRAGPGVLADELEAAARRVGRFFPALPSSSDRCRVGGMVATNAAGARTFKYGATSAHVAELECVLSDGRSLCLRRGEPGPEPYAGMRARAEDRWGRAIAQSWPRVAKNSSGYDLRGWISVGSPIPLLVGSEGTLAVVTRVGFHLPTAPQQRRLVLVGCPDTAGLPFLITQARTLTAAACEFFGPRFLDVGGLRDDPEIAPLTPAGGALLMIEFDDPDAPSSAAAFSAAASAAGFPSLVSKNEDHAARLWRIRHAASPVVAARAREGLISTQFIEDSVVPVESLPEYLERLEAILSNEGTDAVMFGHAGDGNIHVNPLIDVRRHGWRSRVRRILEATVDLVADLGGTLAGEHGDGRVRAPYLARIWGDDLASAFGEVKSWFDPDGILNPGVVVPLPGQDPLAGLQPRARS